MVWLSAATHATHNEREQLRPQAPTRAPALLSMPDFMAHLRWEMQRTNRSASPFSIAIFQTEKRVEENRSVLCDLSRLLQRSLRSTDILGWYGTNAIAALLLHTDQSGTETFAGKVVAESGLTGLQITTRTYPDQSMDLISTGSEIPPSVESLSEGALRFSTAPVISRFKRTLDIVGSIVALVLLSPVMFVTAAAIKMTSPGPIIFSQTRLGFGGTPFVMLKFRSMSVDSDEQTHKEFVERFISNDLPSAEQLERDSGVFKMVSDPRVTPIGAFIRKTSIDELPQLFNVLKGEMSLVGPRPPLSYEVARYKPWHLRRLLDVRPGMTGLWQVEGRSITSFDDMVRLDLNYIDHWSLWLDLKILLKTVKVVLSCKGAL